MGLTLDGNNIVFDGTVTVANGFNAETGTAYLILTPSGGYGSLPFLATGESGLPPVFTSITMTEVDPSLPLPAVNPVVTMVNPGGPGVASQYTMQFFVHAGQAGATGTITISNATDLATSPALGTATDQYILVWNNANRTWVPSAQKVGNIFVPSQIVATAYNNSNPRLLCSITIPPQQFDWYPRCFAQVPVTGSSDTRVDIVARLNDPAAGSILGYGVGQTGATPPVNVMIPAPPAGAAVPGSYMKVAAGASAVIYLRAEQKAASSNAWSTPASGATSPFSTFCVEVVPSQ